MRWIRTTTTEEHAWAEQTINDALKIAPSRIERALLRELPLRPASLAPNELKSSCLVAVELLSRLDQMPIQGRQAEVIARARRIIDAGETVFSVRRFEKLRGRSSSALAAHYRDQGHLLRSLWHSQLAQKSAMTEKLPIGEYLGNEWRRGIEDERRLLLQGEPYLAWRRLTDLRVEDEPRRALLLLAYGLVSRPLDLLGHLRRVVRQRQDQSLDLALALLLARGETNWIDDKSLNVLYDKSDMWSRAVDKVIKSLGSTGGKTVALPVLEDLFASIGDFHEPEYKLLAFGILLSQLHRQRQDQLLAMVEELYKQASREFSDGERDDVWNFLGSRSPRPTTVQLARIPSGAPARLGAGLSLSFGLARTLGPRRLAKLLSGQLSFKSLSSQEMENISDLLVWHLARLKGPLMKIGQTASYAQVGIPPGLSERLRALQSDSVPFHVDSLVAAMDSATADALSEIDPLPVGVGSLGQVHRASLKTGGSVAVKIRFPGVEQAIASDFRLLRALTHILAAKAKRLTWDIYLRDLEGKIAAECDYQREAQAMERIARRFAEYSDIRIPKVHSQISGQNSLVMEYVSGQRMEQLDSTVTQADRDAWGKAVITFVVSSCRDGDFNTDPHPGNFLFRKGELVCLDFGSSCQMPAVVGKAWNSMILASVTNDFETYMGGLSLLGLRASLSSRELDKNFQALMNRVPGAWTYPAKQVLRADLIAEQIAKLSGTIGTVTYPPEFLFGLRVYFGSLSVVAALRAEADWNQLTGDIMRAGHKG